MFRGTGSPSKARRCLNEHFIPLSDSHIINVWEHKLARLQMKQSENLHIFFS